MNPSDEISEFIRSKEGCRLKAYKPLPTDRFTIGYGSTYNIDGYQILEGDEITMTEAVILFDSHLRQFAFYLNKITPAGVTQQQFDAVLSLCYNIGLEAFKSSNTGEEYKLGHNISDCFVKWNISGHKVIPGLTKRRLEEKEIYDNGNYS